MYRVSQKYLEAMKKPVQRHHVKGTVGEVPFTEADILEGSFTITGQCSDTTSVQIGQVYITELKITLLRTLNLSRYTLKGAKLIPYYGLRLGDGTYEYIPLGVFTISAASWGASGVAITAYDNMSKLERSFSGKKLLGTPYELCRLACSSCGLELGMQKSDFSAFANGQTRLQLYEDNDIDTWRDAISWIAQTCACNVFADRDGKIILKSYGRATVERIGAERRFAGATFDDYETIYTGISVVNIEKQTTTYYGEDEDVGLTYNLGTNPFLQIAANGTVEEMRRAILKALTEIKYVPFSVTMMGTPAYDLMDVFCFEDGLADGEKISCMTKYTFCYNEKYVMQGVGQNPALASSKGKSDKNISGLMEQMKSITSSINNLIYDFNTGPLVIRQREQNLGTITYYISEDADVEGHFMMNYVASEPTHLILRFYDQAVEELYSPIEMDIHEGEGHVSVPHAYLRRSVGVHGVYVTAQCLSGEIRADTRDIFFTVNAGNFAKAVDDISMDVRDISMRQLLESNGPDQIWIIGIEDGKLLVSKRAYSAAGNTNPEWEGVYTPGKAKDAALEFDGKWVLKANADRYTIETEDQPWYFWVNMDDDLIAQHGEDEESRLVLDSDVSQVNACKGYSSIVYPEQDQGLVAAYIKGGKPHYRQYVFDTTLGTKRWLPAELFLDEAVTDFRVHRLNDYRMSFEITTQTRNVWAYTDRTYVAQAVRKEQGTIRITEKNMFLYAGADQDMTVTYSGEISEDKKTISILASKRLRYFGSWKNALAFDTASIPDEILEDVKFTNQDGNAAITILLKAPPKKLVTWVTVNPNNTNDIQAEIPGCGYIRAPQEKLTYDTTVYRSTKIPGEQGKLRCKKAAFAYEMITERSVSVNEEIVDLWNAEANIRYEEVTEHDLGMPVETAALTIGSENLSYEQVAPAPI